MTENTKRVKCPKCGRPNRAGLGDDRYWCVWCRVIYDNDPDDGGDYSDRDPAARMIREEERKSRRGRK